MAISLTVTAPLPRPVREVVEDFQLAYGYPVRVWVRTPAGWEPGFAGLAGPAAAPAPDAIPVGEGGPLELRLEVEASLPARQAGRFLAATLTRVLQHEAETRSFGRELAERY